MYSNILVNECKQEISVNSAQAFSPVPSPVLALDLGSGLSLHQCSSVPEYNGCGGLLFLRLYCASCGKMVDLNITCSDRLCPSCREKQYKKLYKRYAQLISQVPINNLALITLTLKINGSNLKEKVKKIRVAWRKLIRKKFFTAGITGGLYTIEIKPVSAVSAAWNVHIHSLAEAPEGLRLWELNGKKKADIKLPGGGLLTWQRLGDMWKQLTKGSFIVDIVPVYGKTGPAAGLRYVMKYMLKAPGMSEAQRGEYNYALKKTKLINLFGSWYPAASNYRFARIYTFKPILICECGSDVWFAEYHIKNELYAFRKEVLRI